MTNKYVIIDGSKDPSDALWLELTRLSDEAAVLRDSVAALSADRDRLRAETEQLRAALKRAKALKGAAFKGKGKANAKRGAPAGRPSVMMQYGALPHRVTPAGMLELLLVTTKQSKRWIIPKGRRIKGLTPAESLSLSRISPISDSLTEALIRKNADICRNTEKRRP